MKTRVLCFLRGIAAPMAAAFVLCGASCPAQTAAIENIPEDAFDTPASPLVDPSAGLSAPSPTSLSSAASIAPARVNLEDDGEKFSLWDFFARFFELRPPGDPNHPDKLRLTIGTAIGYDSNVFTTHDAVIASSTAGINGTAAYNFGSERLKISSSLALAATYYDNRPGDNTDFNGTFNAAVSYLVNRRLQLSASAAVFYASQPNPTLIGGVSRFSGDYSGTNLGISGSYSLRPRLSMRLEYRQNSIRYADDAQNQNLGFTDQSYVIGFDYLFSPRITLTTEYRYNPLSYDEADQDSTGQIFTVGFITSINPRLKWTLQAGVEGRSFSSSGASGGDSSYFGPFLESDLEYNFAPGSSLVGTLRYGTEPSGFAGISIRETLRGSLTLVYAFTPRFSTNLGITYQHDNFDQPGELNDFAQEYYTAGLGLAFQINPALLLSARYDYSLFQAESEDDGYVRGITTLSLQVIF